MDVVKKAHCGHDPPSLILKLRENVLGATGIPPTRYWNTNCIAVILLDLERIEKLKAVDVLLHHFPPCFV